MNAARNQPSRLSQFVAEMKRRHVVRFGIAYLAAIFGLLQLADVVLPAFGIGETGLRILVVTVTLLFPPALVVAWIYDVTATGVERTERAPGEVRTGLLPALTLLAVTVVVVGSVALWLVRRGVLDETPETAQPVVSEPELVAYQPGTPIRSLAVLPLQDFSGDGVGDYFTSGMQEELIAQLSQIPGLRVVSRTSVQRLAQANLTVPGIGRELQVEGVGRQHGIHLQVLEAEYLDDLPVLGLHSPHRKAGALVDRHYQVVAGDRGQPVGLHVGAQDPGCTTFVGLFAHRRLE